MSRSCASRLASSTANRWTSKVGSRTATANRFRAHSWRSSRAAPPLPSSWSAWSPRTARAIHLPGDSRRNPHAAFRLPGDSVDAALADRGQPDHVGSVIRSRHSTPPEERTKRSLLRNASLAARSSGGQARGASGRALRALADLQDHSNGARRLVDCPLCVPAHVRSGPVPVPGPPSGRSGLCVPDRAHQGGLRPGSGAAVLMTRDTDISREARECETPPRRLGYPEIARRKRATP